MPVAFRGAFLVPTNARKGKCDTSLRNHRLNLAQPRRDLAREQLDTLYRFCVCHETRASDHSQVSEAADLVVEFYNLSIDTIGITCEQNALRHRFIRRYRHKFGW